MSNTKTVEDFKIQELLAENEYLIPIYQRDYNWEKEHIEQLIQDVWDYTSKNNAQNYYIGTLVTHLHTKGEHYGKYEVLDGQQRLTTLYILVAALKNLNQDVNNLTKNLNLHFEAREESRESLKNILDGEIKGQQQSIIKGFRIAKEYLENKEHKILKKFTNYLLNNVALVRTIVPEDTDLNHYFEIMGNRGEQLEKHEILKAKLLEKICDNDRPKYAKVWDACSQMDSYVQMNFDTNDRNKLFGENWDNLTVEEITSVGKIDLTGDNEKDENDNTIENIIKNDSYSQSDGKGVGNESERFESIIDFPNFLLQVLKVTRKSGDASLDDKKLLDEFEALKECKIFAEKFIKNLLKYRFRFDKYVIKRKTIGDKSDWSLQQLKKYERSQDYVNTTFTNKDYNSIKMIQAMFHVSNPANSNKRWLNKVFKAFKSDIEESEEPANFLNKLENISKELFTQKNSLDGLHYEDDRPTAYTFNLLDYVIWKEKNKKKEEQQEGFSFKIRNSVEHFYPQNGNYSEGVSQECLHKFGNLALTTGRENSAFDNHSPQEKKNKINGREQEQSLKFQLMLNRAESWNDCEIEKHQKEMIDRLTQYIQIN